MNKERMTAFSDGVIAIIITIMVLELKVPHGASLRALAEVWPVFLSYVLSFVFIAVYWNNHHHLLHACKRVNGAILWSNMHLLFWLSLVPFTTGWMGENAFAEIPVAVYGVSLLAPAIAYFILQTRIVHANGADRRLAQAIGWDLKGKASLVLCSAGIALTFVHPWLGFAAYVAMVSLWLVPDRRIERSLADG
jgi:TMEM175 potassium channel family protein